MAIKIFVKSMALCIIHKIKIWDYLKHIILLLIKLKKMKKIISLMLAVTMICASIGLTAFAATTTTVEAEADGVSAYSKQYI